MQDIYFGTYTKRDSKGIYKASFDERTGQLSDLQLVAQEPNQPISLFSKAGFLYSVGAEEGLGGIASFSPDHQLINHVVDEGAPPSVMSLLMKRVGWSMELTITRGQVFSYRIHEDGHLTLVDQATHQGSGPHENQASPPMYIMQALLQISCLSLVIWGLIKSWSTKSMILEN